MIFASRLGGAGYYPPVVGELTESYANPNGTSSWDAPMSLGSAAADRYIIIAGTWTTNSSRPFVARLGGNTMSLIAGGRFGPATNGQYAYACIWALLVPTGTSATVEVDLSATSGANNGFAMWAYRVVGIDIGNTVTGEDTGNSSPMSADVALRQGDFVVSAFVSNHTPTDNNVITSAAVSLTRAPRQGEDDTRHASYYGNATATGVAPIVGTAVGTLTGGLYLAAAAFRA